MISKWDDFEALEYEYDLWLRCRGCGKKTHGSHFISTNRVNGKHINEVWGYGFDGQLTKHGPKVHFCWDCADEKDLSEYTE